MKFFQLSSRTSDIFIAIYLLLMLFFRFQIENQFRGKYMISIFFGIMTLLFLYALIKNKILNPTYFGLLKEKAPSRHQRRNVKRQL